MAHIPYGSDAENARRESASYADEELVQFAVTGRIDSKGPESTLDIAMCSQPAAENFRTTRTESELAFRLSFTSLDLEEYFSRYPGSRQLFFQVHHNGSLVADTRETITWDPESHVARRGEAIMIPVKAPARLYAIHGTVYERGRPRHDRQLIVRAFNAGLGNEDLLAEAVVRTDGSYGLSFVSSSSGDGQNKPDVIVRLFDGSDSHAVVAESALHLDLPESVSIDLFLDAEPIRQATGFERVSKALQPLLNGLDPDSVGRNESAILARQAGLSGREIQLYLHSLRHSSETGVEAETFFGLLEQLPADLLSLLREGRSRWQTALERSIAANQVDPDQAEAIETIVAALEDQAVEKTLTSRPALVELMEISGLRSPRQRTFLRRSLQSEESPGEFWDSLTAEGILNREQVRSLQLSLQLLSVTFHMPMVSALRELPNIRDGKDLTQLTAEEWRDLIDAHGHPSAIPGNSTMEQRQNYLDLVLRVLDDIFPTDRLIHRLARERDLNTADLERFYLNIPELNLLHKAPSRIIAENPEPLAGVRDAEQLRHDLNGIANIMRLAPPAGRYAAVRTLYFEQGLTSAAALERFGLRRLMEIADRLGGEAATRALLARTRETVSMATFLIARFSPQFNQTLPPGVWPVDPYYQANPPGPTPEDLPDFASLFPGALEFCDCKHCRSVLSPAAYLVDLLQFTRKAVDEEGQEGLERLLEHRPDLAGIELSCENTNTLLPHVDLVLEILERVVDENSIELQGDAVLQTRASAEQLQLYPEHTRIASYATLAEARYPWDLPFDLSAAEADAHLVLLRLNDDVLLRMRNPEPGAAEELLWATRFLGLTVLQRDLITGADPASLAVLYGFPTQNAFQNALLDPNTPNVSTLLEHSGLKLDELEALLEARFVNPDEVEIEYASGSCDPDTAHLDFTADNFDRLVRFWRLLQVASLSIPELDRVLARLPALEDTAIVVLARLQRLQEFLPKLQSDTLLAWWGPISTLGNKNDASPYARLFLNPITFPDPLDRAVFALNSDLDELADTSRSLLNPDGALNEEIAALVAAGLGVRGDRLRALLFELPDAVLNLENLSHLHRLDTLLNALHMDLTEFSTLRALSGLSPFASAIDTGTESTLRFLDAWQRIRRSVVGLAEADYLLRHQGEVVLDTVTVNGSLTALRDELVTIRSQNSEEGISDPVQLAELEERVRQLSENAIWERVSRDLGLDTRVVASLLQRLNHPEQPGAPALEVFLEADFLDTSLALEELLSYPALRRTWEHLHKISLLVEAGGLAPDDVDFLLSDATPLGWLDLTDLPLAPVETPAPDHWQGLLRLSEAIRLNRRFPLETSLFRFLSAQHESVDAVLEELSALLRWSLEDLQFLAGAEGLDLAVEQTRDERWLERLEAIFELSNRAGASAARIWSWTNLDGDFAERYARAQDIKHAARAKIGDALWPKAARPVGEKLRTHRRDALMGYVLARFQSFSSAFDLYQHYLIDSAIEPCFLTSRIKQALASVQLFIQRIWLNLEDGLAFPSQTERAIWEWMKNYRVWEANRKVFLYPENWVQSDFLDRRSPFFEELESELLQDEITLENAERAYRNYLAKLDGVARLEMAGLYEEGDRLHVFARTKGQEPQYYYRLREEDGTWTAWSSVDADIEGDHLIPVVYQNRLMLIWPVFEKVPDEEESEEVADNVPQRAYYTIRLKWSRYENGQWTPSQTSKQVVSTRCKVDAAEKSTKHFYFSALKSTDGRALLVVPTFFLGSYCPNTIILDLFLFLGCTDEPEVKERQPGETFKIPYRVPFTSRNNYMKFSAPDTRDLEMFTDAEISPEGVLFYGQFTTAWLLNPPSRFSVLPPHQFPYFVNAQAPFLYEDPDRVFVFDPVDVVLPSPGPRVGGVANTSGAGIPLSMPVLAQFHYLSGLARTADTPALPALSAGVLAPLVLANQDDCYDNAQPAVDYGNSDYCFEFLPVPISPPPGEPTSLAVSLASVTNAALGAVAAESVKRFRGTTFYHPFVCAFIAQANRRGLFGLLQPDPQEELFRQRMGGHSFQFSNAYKIGNTSQNDLISPLPTEKVDFSLTGAYSQYNWELFFHIPVLMAERLKQEQHFEEAQKWLHTIFNPSQPVGESSQKYWMLKPFFEFSGATAVTDLMRLINEGDPELVKQVHAWRHDAFNPHRIARMRPVAYMKAVVMQYIDLLITWGDSLFRRDTMESVQEAAQLYVMAALLLGDKPQEAPEQQVSPRTFAQVEEELDAFSNALFQMETEILPGFALDMAVLPTSPSGPLTPAGSLVLGGAADPGSVAELGLSAFPLPPEPPQPPPVVVSNPPDVTEPLQSVLYFCVPPNDKLLGYWDTVGDRLFKIRHCMNLEGQVRSLALFEPPIDPALLIQAKAAGLDLASVLNDLFLPLPPYRFNLAVSKATEFCAEVKSLGSQLLSELEKRDAESLALLRAGQESGMAEELIALRNQAIEEAETQLEALKESRQLADIRLKHYGGLLEEQFSVNENDQRKVMGAVKSKQDKAGNWDRLAAITRAAPDATIAIGRQFNLPNRGWYYSLTFGYGVDKVAAAFAAHAGKFHNQAREKSHESESLSFENSLFRRNQDWELQQKVAEQELTQIDQQIAAAQIRIEMASKELRHQELQIEHARETEAFLKGKYTNRDLYNYALEQVSSIYFQSYQLAYEMAKRAERCYRHELGLPDDAELLVRPGHWDSLKKGLLAGEKLHRQLNRLQAAYLDQNRREYELSKSVSLFSLDPEALLMLRATGECFFQVPEELFDLDHPGHYFRRVKSISLSIPCVTGPYVGVAATLTQLGSRIRISASQEPAYPWTGEPDDTRFRFDVGGVQSIATSQGQGDGGVFQLDFRDERYLPFEGSGAVSRWHLRLPEQFRQFDYNTISDVLVHIQYTAREGGMGLRQAAVESLEETLNSMALGADDRQGLYRFISLKGEFPNSMHQLLHPPVNQTTQESAFTLGSERFPFLFHHRAIEFDQTIEIDRIDLVLLLADGLDLADGSGTQFEIEHPSGPTVFSVLAVDGLLRAGEDVGTDLGEWTLRVISVPPALQTEEGRLSPGAIRDIGLMIHFQVS